MMMGKKLDWNNLPPAGTAVVFKGYVTGRHKHWGFEVGKTYYVNGGFWPPCNYNDDFIFELATPFTIKEGDYIDSREFSREECGRFCELAVECGFGRGEWMEFHGEYKLAYLGVYFGEVFWHLAAIPCCEFKYKGNITAQFREFLDKEKGVKKFTKDDLKDGMRVELRKYTHCVWAFDEVFATNPDSVDLLAIINYRQLTQDLRSQCGNTEYDIMKVTDRDGTVLFEREEEPRELTIEEIADAFGLPVERVRIKK